MKQRNTSVLIVLCSIVLTALLPALVFANPSGSVQGYASDAPIDAGSVVRLAGEDTNRVTKVEQSQLQQMFGVVVARNQLPVALTSEGLENETFVAVSGTHSVLVSTQGGSIAAGDYLTLSAIHGVAMKAGTEEATVLGRANAAFDGSGAPLGTASLKDEFGNETKSVSLGSVPVTIEITKNPNEKSTKARVPEALQRLGQAIAEKEVSPVRIYLSMAITAVSIIAAIALLYSGVKNGVISIGRNPMSKKSIFRALLEVILTSILILIIGLFAVYLLLKL